MDGQYQIRLARADEVELLQEIERIASARFEEYGYAEVLGGILAPAEMLKNRVQLEQAWVAVDPDDHPVGFVVVSELGGCGHIDEVDVLEKHGRRGVGTALIEQTCDWARRQRFAAITLSTLQNVPWNAPYYEKLGFRILSRSELSPALSELWEEEERIGLPMVHRVMMTREL